MKHQVRKANHLARNGRVADAQSLLGLNDEKDEELWNNSKNSKFDHLVRNRIKMHDVWIFGNIFTQRGGIPIFKIYMSFVG